jgi:hypothetical protein
MTTTINAGLQVVVIVVRSIPSVYTKMGVPFQSLENTCPGGSNPEGRTKVGANWATLSRAGEQQYVSKALN